MFGWIRKSIRRISDWIGRAGERILTRNVYGGGIFSRFAWWSADRNEQVRHFTGWPYIAIKAICEEIAGMEPTVARRHAPLVAKQYKCLDKQARRKALVSANDDELEPLDGNHPLVRLLHNPNGPDVLWTFLYRISLFLETTGIAYIAKIRNHVDLPCELWVIPSNWVIPRGGEDRFVGHYEVRPTGATGEPWLVEPRDMIVINYPNPVSYLDGYATLQAIGAWVDAAESIDRSRWHAMDNDTTPRIAVELPADYDPDPEMIERFRATFRERYQGSAKSREPIIPPPGGKVSGLSMSPIDMDYVQGGDQLKTWQLAGYRVGSSIVGLAENTNFASMNAARANFILSTIKPKLVLLGQFLTECLAKDFADDLVIYWPDPTPNDPQQTLSENVAYLQAGVKTINEVRGELGLPPYANGGDDPIMPMGSAPMPLNSGNELDVSALAAALQQMQSAQKPQEQPTPPEVNGTPTPELPLPIQARLNGYHANGHKKNGKGTKQFILDVPDERQDNSFSCGAAAVCSVLRFYGNQVEEHELARRMGTDPADGTDATAIIRLLESYGLSAEADEGWTVPAMLWEVQHGSPVICAVQAYGGGHWVVVVGEQDGNVVMQDPSAGRVRIPRAEFEANWHDEDEGRKLVRYGIVVGAKTNA